MGSTGMIPLNWDLEVVPDYCNHVIIPATKTVEIYFGFEGVGKTLDVHLTGKLERSLGERWIYRIRDEIKIKISIKIKMYSENESVF